MDIPGIDTYVNDEPEDPNPGIILDARFAGQQALTSDQARALAQRLSDHADYFDSLSKGGDEKITLKVAVSKIIQVPAPTPGEFNHELELTDWYATHFLSGDASLDRGEYADLNYEEVSVEVYKDPAVVDEYPKGPPLNEHIEDVCTEAGLGVMEQVYGIIADRGDVESDTLMKITAEDVNAHYLWVAEGIDEVERQLRVPQMMKEVD